MATGGNSPRDFQSLADSPSKETSPPREVLSTSVAESETQERNSSMVSPTKSLPKLKRSSFHESGVEYSELVKTGAVEDSSTETKTRQTNNLEQDGKPTGKLDTSGASGATQTEQPISGGGIPEQRSDINSETESSRALASVAVKNEEEENGEQRKQLNGESESLGAFESKGAEGRDSDIENTYDDMPKKKLESSGAIGGTHSIEEDSEADKKHTKEYTSTLQTIRADTHHFKKNNKIQKFPKSLKVHRLKKVSAEILPHNSEEDGSCCSYVRISATATEQLKSDMKGKREYCTIKLITQVFDGEHPCKHNKPLKVREDGKINFMCKLVDSEKLALWDEKKFEISIEVQLQVHSIIRASEVEDDYLYVSTHDS